MGFSQSFLESICYNEGQVECILSLLVIVKVDLLQFCCIVYLLCFYLPPSALEQAGHGHSAKEIFLLCTSVHSEALLANWYLAGQRCGSVD